MIYMISRPIQKADYALLLELDRKVYPTRSPVTPKILDKWYQRNPEFGLVYEKGNSVCGMCSTIPLNAEGWTGLINGELAESDLDARTIFDNSRDKKLGIHVYHIEKLDPTIGKLYQKCLTDLSGIVSNLRRENANLRVIGFSGLCVTNEGIELFTKKLNCKEKGYKSKEHILEKEGQKIVFEANSEREMNKKIRDGYKAINRCRMLVTYPSEESMVWKYLK
ncbi:MAG: hypothetical protein NTY20_01235 [Candidatus Aenigmarchaeota archaeon]|nr:hypothetical protein [Candidatus Aenigmarchaeota archaeon]